MAKHCRALRAAGPVAAGAVLARGESAAFHGGPGQYVVHDRREAHARQCLPALGERDFDAQLVAFAMQVIDVVRDNDPFKVPPRPGSNALARIDGGLAVGWLGAQISAPCPGACACASPCGEPPASSVRALYAAEVGALAETGAGDEECHIGGLRLRRRSRRGGLLGGHGGGDKREPRPRDEDGEAFHGSSRLNRPPRLGARLNRKSAAQSAYRQSVRTARQRRFRGLPEKPSSAEGRRFPDHSA